MNPQGPFVDVKEWGLLATEVTCKCKDTAHRWSLAAFFTIVDGVRLRLSVILLNCGGEALQ